MAGCILLLPQFFLHLLFTDECSFRPMAICPCLFVLFFFVQQLSIQFQKKRTLIKGTLTPNPIGQKDMDKVLLDEKSVHTFYLH